MSTVFSGIQLSGTDKAFLDVVDAEGSETVEATESSEVESSAKRIKISKRKREESMAERMSIYSCALGQHVFKFFD